MRFITIAHRTSPTYSVRLCVASQGTEVWSRLPEHWCCAFRQAWAAYVAGTIPVGAVVVDPYGVIAAEKRSSPRFGQPFSRHGWTARATRPRKGGKPSGPGGKE